MGNPGDVGIRIGGKQLLFAKRLSFSGLLAGDEQFFLCSIQSQDIGSTGFSLHKEAALSEPSYIGLTIQQRVLIDDDPCNPSCHQGINRVNHGIGGAIIHIHQEKNSDRCSWGYNRVTP